MINNKGIVIFDGYCNLCSWSVRFIIKHDKKDYFRFASLQSDIAKEILNTFDLSSGFDKSVIFIEENNIYFKSDAALRIAKKLNSYLKYSYYFIYIPKFIRDFIYDVIVKNRYKWFGKKDVCFIPYDDISYKFL